VFRREDDGRWLAVHEHYEYYADNAVAFLADEDVPLLGGTGSAVIQRRPLGVLLGIMPWNFPAYQVARFAGPNLAAGNTVVLKHAPRGPASAALLENLFRDAGFPEGAYVNVYATNEQIIADPRVQGVSLTGSERAGAAVAEIAGRHLKKVVLELGGSDPFIVLSSDDLDATVEAAAPAPLSSPAAAEHLEQQVATAVAGGATLHTAESRSGAWYPPGVLTGVTNFTEELFGPVAIVFRATDEDEAVTIANDTPYGLGSYVFTTDPAQARRVADRLETGMVFVNGVGAEGPELPFGGVKRSGFGRELGRYGIEEFINRKLVRTVA